MDEVHGPDLIGCGGWRTVVAQLCSDTTLRHLVPQLQAHLLVKPINSLGVYIPTLPPQQNMDASVAIADASLANLFDPKLKVSLLTAPGLVMVERSFNPESITSLADRDFPGRSDLIDK